MLGYFYFYYLCKYNFYFLDTWSYAIKTLNVIFKERFFCCFSNGKKKIYLILKKHHTYMSQFQIWRQKKKSLIRNHQKYKDIKLENFHGPVCQTSFKYQKNAFFSFINFNLIKHSLKL
jgi:hypothetical protein